MKKLSLLLISMLIILTGCLKDPNSIIANDEPSVVQTSSEATSTSVPTQPPTLSPTQTPAPTLGVPDEDAIKIVVPDWIVVELTEPIVTEFIYSKSNYRFIKQSENCYTYFMEPDDYNQLLDILNPPDFALAKNVYPEDFLLVNSIEINSSGDVINVEVLNSEFFTAWDRISISNLAYQCALYKCITGTDIDDISIEVNYTNMDSNQSFSTSIPLRLKSVIDSTENMSEEFIIHIPLEYTMGDPESTKQQILSAGIEQITINEDGTLDYVATKEQIIQMENDYQRMTDNYFVKIVRNIDFITDIYYDDLKTAIIVEIDSDNYDINYLLQLQDFLNSNTQFHQLFAGVKPEDIQFKLMFIGNEYYEKILETVYPPYKE